MQTPLNIMRLLQQQPAGVKGAGLAAASASSHLSQLSPSEHSQLQQTDLLLYPRTETVPQLWPH